MKKYIFKMSLITLILSNLFIIKANASIPSVPKTITINRSESIYFPNYQIDSNFNIANIINYDNVNSNVYNRAVFKEIINGNYNENIKESYYKDSIRYFYMKNNENIYDFKNTSLLTGRNIKTTSVIVEDYANVLKVEDLVKIYLNVQDTDIYTFTSDYEKEQFFKNKSNSKVIIFNPNTKYLYGFVDNDCFYEEKIEQSKLLNYINDCLDILNKGIKENQQKTMRLLGFGIFIPFGIFLIIYFLLSNKKR